MELKERAKKLIAERDRLDAEIEENLKIVEENGCTMDSPLCDAEGYPFSHIDVYSVRKARHNIIRLRNDRKVLDDEIKKAIEEVHSESVHKISKLPSPCEGTNEGVSSATCCKGVSDTDGRSEVILLTVFIVVYCGYLFVRSHLSLYMSTL
ncbi:hypothetical protein KIN20_029675 [Parelaphostrongylus tenuis]|uniref:Nas2 N-terminal domain-containing protein n=1 Tax=Parelaphostrongylus tenuis TaxID=148309 RepID=A0AAD5WGA2_PARTN|nr:hypothetical protein KIN20_029675 [Parelaphostrongylus tenuis]